MLRALSLSFSLSRSHSLYLYLSIYSCIALAALGGSISQVILNRTSLFHSHYPHTIIALHPHTPSALCAHCAHRTRRARDGREAQLRRNRARSLETGARAQTAQAQALEKKIGRKRIHITVYANAPCRDFLCGKASGHFAHFNALANSFFLIFSIFFTDLKTSISFGLCRCEQKPF